MLVHWREPASSLGDDRVWVGEGCGSLSHILQRKAGYLAYGLHALSLRAKLRGKPRPAPTKPGNTAAAGPTRAVLSAYYANNGANDVTITNAAGTSYYGAEIDRSSLSVSTPAPLIIKSAGQAAVGELGGILLSDGATMSSSSGFLMVLSSVGQGITAVNNSHVTLSGATVTGGMHGGLLAVNNSSIDLTTGNALTQVSGNNVDLFCDATSMITGTVNSTGVRNTQCANLSSSEVGVLP